MTNFKRLSVISSIVSITLFIVLLLVPQLIFQLFAIEGNDPAYFISRRAAMLFLGYATLMFMGRNAQHSDARQALILGVGVSMMGLAILGSYELVRGYVGVGILFAIIAEVIISLSYFYIWFLNHNSNL